MDPPDPNAGGAPSKAMVSQKHTQDDTEKSEECIVCEETFTAADFSSRRSTRYAGHCPKCSLELRSILAASKGAPDESGTGGSADDGSSTSKYLTNLAKTDKDLGGLKYLSFFFGRGPAFLARLQGFPGFNDWPHEDAYRKIFADYRESTSSSAKRGRGNVRQHFNPKSVSWTCLLLRLAHV